VPVIEYNSLEQRNHKLEEEVKDLKQKYKDLERENKNIKTNLSESDKRVDMLTKLKNIQRNSFDSDTFSDFESFLSSLKELRKKDLYLLDLKQDYNNNVKQYNTDKKFNLFFD